MRIKNPTKLDLTNIFKPYIILMILGGYNYSGSDNIIVRLSQKIYSSFLILIISYSCMTCCPNQEVSLIWSLLEYIFFVVSMMFNKTNIYMYFRKVYILDTYLRVNRKYYYSLRMRMFVFLLLITIMRLVHLIIYCGTYNCYTSISLFLIYEYSLVALDFNRVWRYSLFEEAWRRLRLLRQRIEENPEWNVYLYVKDNKAVKEDKYKFCLKLYRDIADLLGLMSFELNASLFMSVLCSLPKLVLNVYRILLVIDNKLPELHLGYMLTHLIQISLFIFAPCILVEMCRAEVENIRLFLMHKLFNERDPKTMEDIQLFLQYTKIRDFRYRIWRVIPMDLTLPLVLLDLCTTYVIVVVNFTQVFT